jgi:excisionase family DNA binding protein
MKPTDRQDLTPIAFRVADACRYIGISRSSLYELNRAGVLQFVRVAGRTLVRRADLDRLIETTPTTRGRSGRGD